MGLIRNITGVLGVGFAAAAIWAGFRASAYNREFREAFAAVPAEGAIDLSTVGTTRMPFHSDYPISHGIGVFLLLPEEPREKFGKHPGVCTGLAGEMTITNAAGEVIWAERIEPLVSVLPPEGPEAVVMGRPRSNWR